ncbi:alpha/beta hydrolase [Gordonia sp. NPDC003376]
MTTLVDIRSTDAFDDSRAVDSGPVVVCLHGFGSNEQDLAGLAPLIAPDLRWASLRGPRTLQPGSFAWFPIETPGVPDPAKVATATDLIWEWVEATLPPSAPIVAVGFSQGGLMATQLLRTRPDRIAATVILGGFVQGGDHPGDGRLARTRPPVFWGRGVEDTVIAPVAIERTIEWLPAHSTPDVHRYPGLAHGVNQAEIDDVRAFLAAATGGHAPTI